MVDIRKPLAFETMHNAILNKVITYTPRMDQMDFSTVCTIYRATLDLFMQPQNLIAGCTEMLKETDALYRLRPLWLQRCLMGFITRLIKQRMNNFGLTNLGRLPFKKEVMGHLLSFDFRSWPDIGSLVVAVVDFNGVLTLDVCENYANKGVVPAFVDLLKSLGINVSEKESCPFVQAHMQRT